MTDIKDGMPERWKAVIWYRSDAGLVDVEHYLQELEDIHDLVESGPDWNAIEHIEIRLHCSTGELTLEKAASQ